MATEPFHPFRSEQAREEFRTFYLQKAKRWPIPSETRLIDTASGVTFVRISGKASDRPWSYCSAWLPRSGPRSFPARATT